MSIFNRIKKGEIHFTPYRQAGEFESLIPTPAIRSIPDWYKSIKRNYPSTQQDIQRDFRAAAMPNGTIKKCIPFLESFSVGYVYTLPCDVKFDEATGAFAWNTNITPITIHDPRQVEGFKLSSEYLPSAYKWSNFNSMRTPKGWSCIITHPLNRLDLPFTTLSAVVDTDKHTQAINFPFMMKSGFNGVIPAGTPLVQIIPFKRSKWKSITHKFNQAKGEKENFEITKYIEDNYKKTIWEKKDYE
jgi:hypothetical protein